MRCRYSGIPTPFLPFCVKIRHRKIPENEKKMKPHGDRAYISPRKLDASKISPKERAIKLLRLLGLPAHFGLGRQNGALRAIRQQGAFCILIKQPSLLL